MGGQGLRGVEAAAILAIGTDKICVAEIAHRIRPVFLTPRPEIAFAEPAEHRRASSLGTLTLESVKGFLDAVHQARRS
jgi:hypothetical protein